MFAKPLLTRLKPYVRWVILGGTLFFIAKTLKDHWQEVIELEVSAQVWPILALALGITLLAHIWSGWVWHWILAMFNQHFGGGWSTRVYLKTNVAKYLPGNVWHFYGRVKALQDRETPIGIAVISVVMEPLLMAVAALILGCLGEWQMASAPWRLLQLGILCGALISVHPYIFNPVLQTLSHAKAKAQGLPLSDKKSPQLRTYPLRPLLGEVGFVALRSLGFLCTVAALQPLTLEIAQSLIGSFSLAWLLGLVVPGAPGGIGVFEATAISLLSGQLPTAIILSSIAFYRLLSTLAEVAGAALAWLSEKVVGTA